MHPFVKSLKESPFFTVLTQPVQAAIRDSHNIFSTKTDVVGSFVRLLGNVGCFIVGIFLVYQWSPSLALKLEAFWLALNAPEYMVPALVAYSGGWMISYPGGEVVTQTLRVWNYCRFGDYDYFLTPSEIEKVAKRIIKAEARGDTDIDSVKEEVLKVLEYCTEKIRSPDEAVQDMANVYKRIFTALRKGNLVPYYEHSTLMKSQEQKMVEIAQSGRAEILKIERQIQALQDGISLGEESDSDYESDLEGEIPQPKAPAISSPRGYMPDLSGFKSMQAQIVGEIRSLERRVSELSEAKRDEGIKGTLPDKLSSWSLSLQRVELLNKQREAWEQYLVLLTKKNFSLLQSKFDIEVIIQSNDKKIENILGKKDSHADDEQITSFIQRQESSIRFEQERQRADLLDVEHELEAVAGEIVSARSKLESSGAEKSTLEEEVKSLVLRSIDKIKEKISSLESKVSENEQELALIDSDIIFIDEKITSNEEKIRDAHRKKSELQRRTSSYDIEANLIDESLADDRDRDREREVVDDGEVKVDDVSPDALIASEIKLIEKQLQGLQEHSIALEKDLRALHEKNGYLRSSRAELESDIRNARQEVSELTIGGIVSLPIEKRFNVECASRYNRHNDYSYPVVTHRIISPSAMYRREERRVSAPVHKEIRRPEPVMVTAPSEESTYDSPVIEQGYSSGVEMTAQRSYEPASSTRAINSGSRDVASLDREPVYSDESSGGRRVRIEGVTRRRSSTRAKPLSRRSLSRGESGDVTMDNYHMHIQNRSWRSKAQHVSGMEPTEKEKMIRQLKQRKKHLQRATKSAEKRYKAV